VLDALAFRLDLAAAGGRHPLIVAPLAISIRATSTIVRRWKLSWVGTFLGLSWVIRTYRQSKQSPFDQIGMAVARKQSEIESRH
jgi:hypothetical protein